jgi:hypothetical protein
LPLEHPPKRNKLSTLKVTLLFLIFRDYARLDENLEQPEIQEKASASLLDIFRVARPEHKYIYFGLVATVIRGVVWPVSILNSMFYYLSF